MRSSRSAPDPLFAGGAGYAHRGLHAPGTVENSLASFRAAIDAGAGVECDLRLSSDGVAMVFHDSSLVRLCGADVEAESLDAATLGRYRQGGGDQHIARLSELLALVDGKAPLLIELKRRVEIADPIDELCRATREALSGYRGPVGVMSFDPRAPAWFARHAPDVRRGLVIADRPVDGRALGGNGDCQPTLPCHRPGRHRAAMGAARTTPAAGGVLDHPHGR